jgi:hypothetical protein
MGFPNDGPSIPQKSETRLVAAGHDAKAGPEAAFDGFKPWPFLRLPQLPHRPE